MATRADFYVLHKNNDLEFLGSTSDNYNLINENPKKLSEYLDEVNWLLKSNQSIPKKWYWPWKNSKLTDEVFIFKIIPKFYTNKSGILMRKVYTDGNYDNGLLGIVEQNNLYNTKYYNEETGVYNPEIVTLIQLPNII